MSGNLSFAWEPIERLLGEGFEDLLVSHWEEVALEQSIIPLEVDWPRYITMEKAGTLKVLAMRRGARFVGYNAFFISPSMHYRNTLHAVNDVIYVDPEERRGSAGVRLIREADRLLKGLGVVKVVYHIKLHVLADRGTIGKVLQHLGYTEFERLYSKVL